MAPWKGGEVATPSQGVLGVIRPAVVHGLFLAGFLPGALVLVHGRLALGFAVPLFLCSCCLLLFWAACCHRYRRHVGGKITLTQGGFAFLVLISAAESSAGRLQTLTETSPAAAALFLAFAYGAAFAVLFMSTRSQRESGRPGSQDASNSE